MKSERAKEIIESDMGYMTEGGWIFDVVDRVTAYQAVELAEQEAEERVYEKLTRWNDPKNRPPYGVSVLIKVFCVGGEKIYLGNYDLHREKAFEWENYIQIKPSGSRDERIHLF